MSQQSSPRRSLIPQPTRQRSTSLSKSTERLSSPKLGRRTDSRGRLTDSRNRLNASGNSNSVASLASRRQATRTPSKLSPIQGTPTKPERTSTQIGAKRDRSGGKESTPARQQKLAVSPSRHNAWNAKKQSQERVAVSGKAGGSKERVTSPSKIPLKTNRVGTNSLNPSRFITISNQPKGRKAVDKGGSKGVSDERVNGQDGEEGCETGWKESRASEKSSSVERLIPDLHLIDLLKQTSTATGTSSVVNTTATTAVQPLHIDANAILLDGKDSLEKKNVAEERSKSQQNSLSNDNKSSSSPNVDDSSKQIQSSQLVGSGEDHHRQTNSQISRSNKSNGNYNRMKSGMESRNDSPIPNDVVNNHSKSNGTGQSAKSKGNGAVTNNVDSATQRSNNKIQMNNAINDPNGKNSRPNDAKIEESVTFQPVSNSAKTNEVESSKDSTRNCSSTERGSTVVSVNSGSVKQEEARTISRSTNNSGTRVVANAGTVIVKSTSVSDRSSISSKANNNALVNNDAKKVNSETGAKVGNEGSGTSLKSSGGVSVDSIESVRSTDTGVSVDTVRGVSSPREKTGMHVVKRPQEIETLSGNVVHLEQNGEPA